MKCKFEVNLDEEDQEGIAWVQKVMAAIQEKGPEHRSYAKAAAFARALNKIRDYCNYMHASAHIADDKVEIARERLTIQPWGEA